MNSQELLKKLNDHRDNIGEAKATFQEGFLYGYSIALKEFQLNTCENCEWCHNEVCCNDESPLCADFVSDDFGCVHFNKK